jgi:hypothetical protein
MQLYTPKSDRDGGNPSAVVGCLGVGRSPRGIVGCGIIDADEI